MDADSNLEDNAVIVHQLLKELDTLLISLETQTKLDVHSQLELERIEAVSLEEQSSNLEDDFLANWL